MLPLFFYKMIIIAGFISLFHSGFSLHELTGLPLEIVVQAVTSLFVIVLGVLNMAGNRRKIQAATDTNKTKCDTQCNLPRFYICNHRGKAISVEHLPTSTKADLEKIVFMAAQEDEIKSLKEKNNVLVQEVEHWKATAAQRENEKLDVMKENIELRQKVIRLKSDGAADARMLETLQSTNVQTLEYLARVSSAIALTIEQAKIYRRDLEGPDVVSPRWNSIGNSTEKVHRVPPMMTGGQSIQPVVPLSRAL